MLPPRRWRRSPKLGTSKLTHRLVTEADRPSAHCHLGGCASFSTGFSRASFSFVGSTGFAGASFSFTGSAGFVGASFTFADSAGFLSVASFSFVDSAGAAFVFFLAVGRHGALPTGGKLAEAVEVMR